MEIFKSKEDSFRGIAFSRYKNSAAYCAVGVELNVTDDLEIKLNHAWITVDAGEIAYEDGIKAQVEGGFIQGQGWLTMEEVVWGNDGRIKTFSPSTYKIPAATDIPKIFNVEIFRKGLNVEKVVNKAKTTGEPPLMLAMSVFFAIKDAIASVENYLKIPILNAPATPENILMSIKEIRNRKKSTINGK